MDAPQFLSKLGARKRASNIDVAAMSFRGWSLIFLTLVFAVAVSPARAQDAQICFDTADRVTEGDTVTEAEKEKGHKACMRALSDTASIVHKYHLQEADFDIMGNRPKP